MTRVKVKIEPLEEVDIESAADLQALGAPGSTQVGSEFGLRHLSSRTDRIEFRIGFQLGEV